MPLISIVVPVYNAECFLKKSIDSILNQSYQDFELILVDDGSTDHSWKLINTLAANDKRIKIFHKENGGPGDARNYGISQALGNWIAFIDSDDTVDSDYLQKLINASKDVDLVLCGMKLINNESTTLSKIFIDGENPKKVLQVEEIFEILRLYTLSGPICKLFKRSIIEENKLMFPTDMKLGEDSVFVYSYLQHIDKLYILDDYHGYNVMLSQNENSLTKRARPRDLVKAYQRIYEKGKIICKERNIKTSENLDSFFLDGILLALKNTGDKQSSLSKEERYHCYNLMADMSLSAEVSKKLPFFFSFFKYFRSWKLYEILYKCIYLK